MTVTSAGRTVYLAGQCPLDATGTVVDPDDISAQVDQVAANALAALRSVGAGPDDVVRTVIYVASSEQSVLAAVWRRFQESVLAAVWRRFQESVLAAAFGSASTLLGVAQLGFPGQRVELDVTATLSDS